MTSFRKIIIGASCWSAGAVLKGEPGVVVIDRAASIGREYFDCYRNCSSMNGAYRSSAARELHGELAARGKEGDPPALAPLLYRALHEHTGQFLLWTEIPAIGRKDGFWELTLHNADGRSVVRTRELIDGTPECRSNPGFRKENVAGTALNAVVFVPRPGLERLWPDAPFRFRPGRREDELFLSLEMEGDAGWTQARRLLMERWESRPAEWREAGIFSIAKAFDYRVKKNSADFGDGYTYFNPAVFAEPLAAVDCEGRASC